MAQKTKQLLCFADENNLHILIASAVIKYFSTLVIFSDCPDKKLRANLFNYFKENSIACEIIFARADDFNPGNISWDGAAIVSNSCTYAEQYQILVQAVKNGADVYYADTNNGRLLLLGREGVLEIEGGPVELRVQDVMGLSGMTVDDSIHEQIESDEVTKILSFIIKDKRRWDKIRSQIKNNVTVLEDWITLGAYHPIMLNPGSPVRELIDYFKAEHLSQEIAVERTKVNIKIPNPIIRRFFEVVGIWLEALTYRAIRNLPYIDDAMVSVKFLWDDCPEYLANELDVLATADSRMIVVSCKDTQLINTSVLNELEVYSQKIGGDEAIKLLVTSMPAESQHFIERARAMNIHLVYFNGDVQRFSSIIDQILRSEIED